MRAEYCHRGRKVYSARRRLVQQLSLPGPLQPVPRLREDFLQTVISVFQGLLIVVFLGHPHGSLLYGMEVLLNHFGRDMEEISKPPRDSIRAKAPRPAQPIINLPAHQLRKVANRQESHGTGWDQGWTVCVFSCVEWCITCYIPRERPLSPRFKEQQLPLHRVGQRKRIFNGFRSRNLFSYLYPKAVMETQERRYASGRETTGIRLLSVDSIIWKVAHMSPYVLVTKGGEMALAILEYPSVISEQLENLAA